MNMTIHVATKQMATITLTVAVGADETTVRTEQTLRALDTRDFVPVGITVDNVSAAEAYFALDPDMDQIAPLIHVRVWHFPASF